MDEAPGLVQGQLDKFGSNLGTQVRDNPLRLLLIGAGIGMLALNARNGGHAHRQPISEEDWRSEHNVRKVEQGRSSVTRAADETEHGFSHRPHEAHAVALDLN